MDNSERLEAARRYISKMKLLQLDNIPRGKQVLSLQIQPNCRVMLKDIYMSLDNDGSCVIDIPNFVDELSPTCEIADVTKQFIAHNKLKIISKNLFSLLGSGIFLYAAASKFRNLDLQEVNFDNVEDFTRMFAGCNYLRSITFGYGGKNIKTFKYAFRSCFNLEEIDFGNLNLESLESIEGICSSCYMLRTVNLEAFKTAKKLRTISDAFLDCRSISCLDVSVIHQENLENCSNFMNGTNVYQINLENWKPSKPLNMNGFCQNCENMYQFKFGRFKVESSGDMFKRCHSIKDLDVSLADFQDLKNPPSQLDDDIGQHRFAIRLWREKGLNV